MVKTDCNNRFWSKIDQTLSCWLWTAATDDGGYGRFLFQGKNRQAHIVMWILMHGDVPYGQVVMHTCDVPSCVNPDHLKLGTQAENIADCVSKNRHFKPKGTLNNQAKLTDNQVKSIRQEYRDTKCTKRSLALKYDMSDSAICRLINGQTWS